jgi:hypothetical protein
MYQLKASPKKNSTPVKSSLKKDAKIPLKIIDDNSDDSGNDRNETF